MDGRLTPSSALSFGQEITRSPGTSTNRKSSSPRRTTSVLTTSAGATPRACAASARLRTGPCRITRWARPTASAAASAGVDTVQYRAPSRASAGAGVRHGGQEEHSYLGTSILSREHPVLREQHLVLGQSTYPEVQYSLGGACRSPRCRATRPAA